MRFVPPPLFLHMRVRSSLFKDNDGLNDGLILSPRLLKIITRFNISKNTRTEIVNKDVEVATKLEKISGSLNLNLKVEVL